MIELLMGLYLIVACAFAVMQEAYYAEVVYIKDKRFEQLPGFKNMEAIMWGGFWLFLIGLVKVVIIVVAWF